MNSSGDISTGSEIVSVGANHYEEGITWGMINSTEPYIAPCDSTYPYPYINFTFKDESSLNNLNASMSGTTITSNSNTSSYNISTELPSIAFCSYSNTLIVNATFYAPYSSGTYPQRIHSSTYPLTNITTNKVLYLLSASDGLYVTFQLINAAEQPLSNVVVEINKSISGNQVVIATGTTGADGGITFWLNPDDQYTVTASLSPYPIYSTTQAFTQSSYTITLGSSVSANASDYSKGIITNFAPTGSHLQNGTVYNFNLTISSTYWSLDEFGFNITNQTGALLGNISNTTSTGGITAINVNTGQGNTIYVTYYYKINNDSTIFSRSYRLIDLTNNQYSIKRLFTDFNTYVDTGLFGLTDFGIGLIVFFLIVGIVGTARVKFGLSDEGALMGIVFALVLFFDVSVGLLPNPVGAIPHFPTWLMLVIFVGTAIYEVTR